MQRRSFLTTPLLLAAPLAASNSIAEDLVAADGARPSGRLRHSVVPWCFRETHSPEQLIALAPTLGLSAIELIDPKHWPAMKDAGLACAIAGSHGFRTGPNHRANWDQCRRVLTERIGQAAAFGVERVITFVGMATHPEAGRISRDEGLANCEAFFKSMMPACEAAGVTLCLEMLNSRDDSHPMKGHPGYQGDDIDQCAALCRRVGSARMRLLFDIYHVQIMNGDLIRRIREHAELIGHVHTAGNPGRGELDDSQEINYPAVAKALIEVGYDGFVGHEFIPTGDPVAGLRQAIAACGGA